MSYSRLKFYSAEEEAFTGRWQEIMPAAMAYRYLEKLAYATGESMPIVTIEPTGPNHLADANNIWLMADDVRPLILCHEFAHVIQCRNTRGLGGHDTDFATLLCLVTEVAP